MQIAISNIDNSIEQQLKAIGIEHIISFNQALKLFNYVPQQLQISKEQAEFNAKNKRYTDSLRGLNNDKFPLLKPEDMPEHAKEMVKKLEYLKQAYLAGENFYIDKEKTMLLQDFCSRGYMNGVRRIGGYQEHLIHVEVNLGLTFKTVIENSIENISQFSNYLKNKNIPFMYMQLPCKLSPISDTLPEGTLNISNIKSSQLVEGLIQNGVNVFDYRKYMVDNNIDFLDNFFKTDGHWKPSTSLNATIQLCKKIEEFINVDIDWDKLNIENYNRIIYPKIFLGSEGKTAGVLYSGLDDFELILPIFETNVTWTCPERGFIKCGSVDKALIYPLHLSWDYDIVNPYASYSLSGNSHSIIKNNKVNNNLKILCINDSFSNPLSLFLSTQFTETHFLDLRETRKNLFGIIDEIKPDVIVMLYMTTAYNRLPMMTDVNPKDHFNI